MRRPLIRMCDCSPAQLRLVGCDCGGEPPMRDECAEEERRAELAAEEALERSHREERAFWDAENARMDAQGYDWNDAWGDQPYDQHVRDHLTRLDRVEAMLMAA